MTRLRGRVIHTSCHLTTIAIRLDGRADLTQGMTRVRAVFFVVLRARWSGQAMDIALLKRAIGFQPIPVTPVIADDFDSLLYGWLGLAKDRVDVYDATAPEGHDNPKIRVGPLQVPGLILQPLETEVSEV